MAHWEFVIHWSFWFGHWSFPLLLLFLLLPQFLLLLFLLLADQLRVRPAPLREDFQIDRVIPLRREGLGDAGQLFDIDGDVDGLFGVAAVNASVGGDIPEIPPDADFDEVSADQAVIGGIEADPA